MTDVRVVGVAVLRDDASGPALLAARRADGPGSPGGWELPGGKCEPGESLEAAARREIREELDCGIRVVDRLPGVQRIRPGLTLEVVVAELVEGVPRALEHAELRWLPAADLETVAWLPADIGFVAQLRHRLAGLVGGDT